EKGGAMEPARAEKILNQICGSLEEAHGRGIVHRDLKPDNIVLTERAGQKDFVKVLDFGIAKRSNEEDKNEQKLTQQGMVLGTPPYMSPEQFTGKPIDARSDIYSLGVMAYEMLTANLPFQANTAWEWATQHMTVPPRDIDTMPQHERIPPRMKDALRKALAKTPEERFPNVRAFLDAFVTGAGMPQQAAPVPLAGGKGRTEVGTPLDFGAGGAPPQYGSNPGPMSPYGSNPGPMSPYGSNPGPMQPYPGQAGQGAPAGTPAFGNVAFPTPHAGVPQPPPNARAQAQQGGGNRGLLLAIAGVVAVGSIAAVVLGTRKSSAPSDFSMLDAGGSTSTAVLNLIDAGAVAPPPVDSTPLAALDPAKPAPPSGGHPAAHHDGGAKEPPGKEPPGKEPPGSVVPPGTPGHPSATPPPPPPAGKVPFQCEQASLMRKAGNIGAYQALKKACEAAGGTVPN
ncbi:MAG TPA: protein kinase, partial [Polyangiaceae bacterium]